MILGHQSEYRLLDVVVPCNDTVLPSIGTRGTVPAPMRTTQRTLPFVCAPLNLAVPVMSAALFIYLFIYLHIQRHPQQKRWLLMSR